MTDKKTSDHAGDDPFETIDVEASKQEIQAYLDERIKAFAALPDDSAPQKRASVQLDMSEAMVGLGRGEEAWSNAREAFDCFLQKEMWQEAVECCDVLYQSDQPAALTALGQGVWLSVTYPVDTQLSVNMLGYIIDETPDNADGAALAAVTAHYLADIRSEGERRESLMFLTKNMVANVAQRHSEVEDQEGLQQWMEKLQLLDPDDFLPKLSLVVGAIVPQDQWWFDREELRSKLPEN